MHTLPKKSESPEMFNDISKTYDLLNHILSFGLDIYWRRRLCKNIPTSTRSLLDLATGTGDQLLLALKKRPQITLSSGVDPAKNMLSIAHYKLKNAGFHTTSLVQAYAEDLPFNTESYNCITMSFGIRNLPDHKKALQEIHRVLTPKGKLLILEFSLPKYTLLKVLHLFYLRKVLPVIGGLISKKKEAYVYLNQTIETFPYGKALCNYIQESGFNSVTDTPLFGGIVTLYEATK